MTVVSLHRSTFATNLLTLIKLRRWDVLKDALNNGASAHVLVLPEMNLLEVFLRHLAKPSLFQAPENIDEEYAQKRIFGALLSSWHTNDPNHLTPLTLATMMGRPDLVEMLLSAGHDPNEVGNHHQPATILADPYMESVPTSLRMQRTALENNWAEDLRSGQHACFRLLLSAGLRIDAPTWKGHPALMLACLSKNIPIIVHLLDAGANPEGGTQEPALSPLEVSIDIHHELAVDVLLTHGANPLRAWSQTSYLGLPIATVACAQGQPEMIEKLAANLGGLQHQTLQQGWWLALSEGNDKNANWFIRHGQDIHARNQEGSTSLHFAALSGNVALIERLIALGLDRDATNAMGETPRTLLYRHHPAIASSLGARVVKVGEHGNVIAWRPRKG